MTFALDAQVAAVLAAAIERSGPPQAPPVGDVASHRVALDAMLDYRLAPEHPHPTPVEDAYTWLATRSHDGHRAHPARRPGTGRGRMSRKVQFDHYGPPDVLHVVDVPRPPAGDGQVLVQVAAAGINPGRSSSGTARWSRCSPRPFRPARVATSRAGSSRPSQASPCSRLATRS